MKKILTLFAMLLVTASTLLAQAPSLSYQMIVRNQKADSVTINGGRTYAPNDLVYSQAMDVFVAILESAGDVVKMWAFTNAHVTNAPVTENGMIAPQATTNMNGMLSLTLNDYAPVSELPVQMPSTVNAHVNLKWFKDIKWNGAKFVVAIPTYGIMDTVEILPVPYALTATNIDTFLTTEQIVNYLTTVTEEELNKIIAEFWANEQFSKGAQDTVVNIVKNNPGAVRNLALYFLHKVNAADVNAFDAALPADVKTYLKGKIVDYAKEHEADAVKYAVFLIGDMTRVQVGTILDSAMDNAVAASLMHDLKDTVVNYLKRYDVGKKIVKSVVDYAKAGNVTTDDIANVQNYIKTEKNDVYMAMRNILDTLIQNYLDTVFYAVSDSCYAKENNGERINICGLVNDFKNVQAYGLYACPDLGTTTHAGVNFPYTLTTTIINNADNINLTEGTYKYILSFPNSNYKNDTIPADLGTNNSFSAQIDNSTIYAGRVIVATPYVTGLHCRTRQIFGPSDTIVTEPRCENLHITSFTNTDPQSALALYTNQGVLLEATINENYGNIDTVGFLISKTGGFDANDDIDTLGAGDIAAGTLQYSAKLTMNYCAQTVKVKAFLKCHNSSVFTFSTNTNTINVRGPQLAITADNNAVYNPHTDVTLTASATMTMGSNGWTCLPTLNNVSNPTLEQLIYAANNDPQACDQAKQYKDMTPVYTWTCINDVDTVNATNDSKVVKASPDKAIPGDNVNYTCTVSVNFLGATCKVSDTIEVLRGFTCGDVYPHQGSLYNTVKIGNQCWTRENMRAMSDSLGNTIRNFDNAINIVGSDTVAYYFTPSSNTGLTTEEAGLLYNYLAAAVVCPKGWHLPADSEWVALETYVHEQKNETVTFTDTLRCLAKYLVKVGKYWGVVQDQITVFADASDDYQFSACPAGSRQKDGLTTWFAGFWSKTPSTWTGGDDKHFCRALNPIREKGGSRFLREDAKDYGGMSVRCVKNN